MHYAKNNSIELSTVLKYKGWEDCYGDIQRKLKDIDADVRMLGHDYLLYFTKKYRNA